MEKLTALEGGGCDALERAAGTIEFCAKYRYVGAGRVEVDEGGA